MEDLSRASRRTISGFMAALMAAVISAWSGCSVFGAVWLFGGGWRVVVAAFSLPTPVFGMWTDAAFFGRGVGEGATRGAVAAVGEVGRPLGVAKGDGRRAARGGLVRVGVGGGGF
jgi:hypothetical protein